MRYKLPDNTTETTQFSLYFKGSQPKYSFSATKETETFDEFMEWADAMREGLYEFEVIFMINGIEYDWPEEN